MKIATFSRSIKTGLTRKKILDYGVLNSVTQNTIKTLVFRENTQDKQQVRENMAAVLSAPAIFYRASFYGGFLFLNDAKI